MIFLFSLWHVLMILFFFFMLSFLFLACTLEMFGPQPPVIEEPLNTSEPTCGHKK